VDFEELLDKYEKPIYNLVLRLVGDAEDAADLTQDVFVSAYRNSGSFRSDSSEYTWLYRIAVNHCKNRFRQRIRKRTRETYSLDDETRSYESGEPVAAAETPNTPWESLHKKELQKHIEEAILNLPYDYKVVVVLRDMQDMTYQEISDVLGVTVDIVRTRLARARGNLRKNLEPYLKP
jgi:RNA polymerase sigma-70 factor, ECF subfamily